MDMHSLIQWKFVENRIFYWNVFNAVLLRQIWTFLILTKIIKMISKLSNLNDEQTANDPFNEMPERVLIPTHVAYLRISGNRQVSYRDPSLPLTITSQSWENGIDFTLNYMN